MQLIKTIEKQAWNSLKAKVNFVLRNNRADNDHDLIQTMIECLKIIGCRMPLKVHMQHAHIDQIKDNMDTYSEEQEGHFHRDKMDFQRK